MSTMILRSGTKIEGSKLIIPRDKSDDQIKKEMEKEGFIKATFEVTPNAGIQVKSNLTFFPSRLEKSKKQDEEREILEVLQKVAINTPLLNAIKQVPKYVKFLKNLYVNKKKLRGDERVVMEENVLAVLQKKIAPKCRDPSMFPCRIGNTKIKEAMID